jgi:hypothetical protein
MIDAPQRHAHQAKRDQVLIHVAIPLYVNKARPRLADPFGLSAKSGISQNRLCQNQCKVGQAAEKLFLGSTYDEGVRIWRPLLPPLWRKDENLVRNKFAGGDSEDSALSGTSYESSAHSACHFG